jgi:hypothetical protein
LGVIPAQAGISSLTNCNHNDSEITAGETVSQFVKYVIPDSPAQPGVIRNPGFIK